MKFILIYALSVCTAIAQLSISVLGQTNTQAVLAYTAPDSGACTVEVSESATYSPPVHDVDTALFGIGADSDARASGVANGVSRTFVVGARVSQLASDGVTVYSRALQNNTTHYYRVACGALVATGTFKTANIPWGVTYQDLPQLDPDNLGNGLVPTIPDVRGGRIIDPKTGAALYQMTLPADTNYTPGNGGTYGPFMYFGGTTRVCTNGLVGPDNGFLCSFANGDGGSGVLYYVIPSIPPVSRFLGLTPGVAYPFINPVDGKFYSGNTSVAVQSYDGDWQPATYPHVASLTSPTTIVADLGTAIHAFNSAFDASYFNCALHASIGDLAPVTCSRSTQDSYGWAGSLKLSTGQVTGAVAVYLNPLCRWCGIHGVTSYYDAAIMVSTHIGNQDSTLGHGPYITTYTGSNGTITTGTPITVAGEPECIPCGADPALPIAAVGDVFNLVGGGSITITDKADAQHWIVSPVSGTPSITTGEVLTVNCSYAEITWDPVHDPTGASWAVDASWPSGGHDDATCADATCSNGQYYMLTEHWQIRGPATMANQVNHAMSHVVDESATFAGKVAQCFGNGCTSHPSAAAPGQSYLTDFFAFSGATADAHTWTWVTGQLYKRVTYGPYGPILPRHFATAGLFNNHTLTDVSPVTISGTTTDNYKLCISNAADECYAGSAVGDVYANVPISVCNDATGSTTVYACPSAAPTATSYATGLFVRFVPQTTNTTGTPTLNVSSLGAQHIFSDRYGSPVIVGSLVGDSSYYLYYYVDQYTPANSGFIPYASPTCGVGAGIPCLVSFNAYAGDVVQVKLDGSGLRAISGGFADGLYIPNNYPTSKTLGDGSYTLVGNGNYQDAPPQRLFLAKLPPLTAPDAVDRTTFVRAPLTITPPSGLGVATAAVEFGYLEQGTPSQHYCTSRREACVAVASTVTDATPFSYETTDAPTWAACATSCTIALPILPAHVGYYSVKFKGAGGTLVASNRPQDSGVAMDSIGLTAAVYSSATGKMSGVIK